MERPITSYTGMPTTNNDKYSLETDTAAYFLTVNLAGNLRYTGSNQTQPQ